MPDNAHYSRCRFLFTKWSKYGCSSWSYILPFFFAKGQLKQGTPSHVTGRLTAPSGYDVRLEAAARADVGQFPIDLRSGHMCPDIRGPLLKFRVDI